MLKGPTHVRFVHENFPSLWSFGYVLNPKSLSSRQAVTNDKFKFTLHEYSSEDDSDRDFVNNEEMSDEISFYRRFNSNF